MKQDFIDTLTAQWHAQAPELDTDAMHVVGRIMRLGRAFEAQAASALAAFDLSYTEFDIIATLRRTGKPYLLTPGQLSKTVLLTSGAMTAALDRLEAKSLIERVADPSDRRVRAARLTNHGAKRALQASKVRFKLATDETATLTKKQRKALSDQLRIIMCES